MLSGSVGSLEVSLKNIVCTVSIQALRNIQPPIQWVRRVPSPEKKLPKLESDQNGSYCSETNNENYNSSPPLAIMAWYSINRAEGILYLFYLLYHLCLNSSKTIRRTARVYWYKCMLNFPYKTHYATNRKVASSIPDEVIFFLNLPNPSCRTRHWGYSASNRN
jgi:hypothetical protein